MNATPTEQVRSGLTHQDVPTQTVTANGVVFAYRSLGPRAGVPLVLLTHLAAVLDNWDPRIVDGLAVDRRVIAFDNRGVGASSGRTPTTIEEMALDAVGFIRALGFDRVDLRGFSMDNRPSTTTTERQQQGATVKAVIYRRRGTSDVLSLEELPDPTPGPGEVRVRVQVSGVNPTDWKQRIDSRPLGMPYQIPNQDGAGVIDEVGEGVDARRVGQRVWIYFAAWFRAGGTAAEFVVVPQAQAVPLPDSASLDLGASLGIPALTAHRLLFADGPLDTSRPILITAGAGAVGHMAIQLAKHHGATVITTVSSEAKAAIAATAGPDYILNYREDGYVDAIRSLARDGIRRIIDVAPGTNAAVNTSVLEQGGTIATYADDAPLPLLSHVRSNAVVRFVLVYTMGDAAVRAAIDGVTESAERGLVTLPLHRFPLSRTADAHDAVQQGAVGKVLIDVGAP